MRKFWLFILITGVLGLGCTACTADESVTQAATPEPIYVVVTSAPDGAVNDNVGNSSEGSDQDSVEVAYTETDETDGETVVVIPINLSDYAANSVVSIDAAGDYELSGSLTGQVVVNVGDADKVTLHLNNAQITNPNSSAILVENADKVIIALNDGTQNTITDGTNYTGLDESGDPNAAIFSHDDLTINGSGSLTVTGNYQDAIQSRDDLKISGGNITISAVDDGLFGNKSFTLKNDASVTITSGGDSIHSDGDILIESGTLILNSGDDGMHADGTVTIEDGTINVQNCYEGIEGSVVIVNGGVIDILSNDDGINAAGGNDGSGGNNPGGRGAQDTFSGGQYSIEINGGTISIAAGLTGAGDGLDSNGSIIVTGGDTIIKTPSSYRDYSSIDSNSGFTMIGGSVRILNADGTYTEVTGNYVPGAMGQGGGMPGGTMPDGGGKPGGGGGRH